MSEGDEKDVFQWPPLESDPDVFSQYLWHIGMPKMAEMVEIYGLEPDLLSFAPKPVIACVAAIQRDKTKSDERPGDANLISQFPFYMAQTSTLDNACGIIACLHSILNSVFLTSNMSEEANSILSGFWQSAKNLNPTQRAKLLENSNDFKQQHKQFAQQGQTNLSDITSQSLVTHHFVCFVLQKLVINSSTEKSNDGKTWCLVELDGTKRGPSLIEVVGERAENDDGTVLLEEVAKELKRRLEQGMISESMSLMALTIKQ